MIELLLSGGAMALLVLWAMLASKGPRAQPLFALACLCGALFLAVKSAPIATALGAALTPLQAIAATGPLWFLIAARRAFGAAPVLTRLQLGALGAVMACAAFTASLMQGAARAGVFALLDFAMLGMFLGALFSAWRGLGDDLDPGRRARRITLLRASAAFGALVAVSALATGFALVPPSVTSSIGMLITVGVFASAFALCLFTLRPREVEARIRPAPAARSPLTTKILAVLEHDKLYRDPDLTVSRLAHALGAPEHQVRAAVNADLGFKNFSAFINEYRLAEVKAALADAAQMETPISTIALDAGFGSIASFNRVFRSAHGVTPSAFRRDAAG